MDWDQVNSVVIAGIYRLSLDHFVSYDTGYSNYNETLSVSFNKHNFKIQSLPLTQYTKCSFVIVKMWLIDLIWSFKGLFLTSPDNATDSLLWNQILFNLA